MGGENGAAKVSYRSERATFAFYLAKSLALVENLSDIARPSNGSLGVGGEGRSKER